MRVGESTALFLIIPLQDPGIVSQVPHFGPPTLCANDFHNCNEAGFMPAAQNPKAVTLGLHQSMHDFREVLEIFKVKWGFTLEHTISLVNFADPGILHIVDAHEARIFRVQLLVQIS